MARHLAYQTSASGIPLKMARHLAYEKGGLPSYIYIRRVYAQMETYIWGFAGHYSGMKVSASKFSANHSKPKLLLNAIVLPLYFHLHVLPRWKLTTFGSLFNGLIIECQRGKLTLTNDSPTCKKMTLVWNWSTIGRPYFNAENWYQ